MHVLITAERLFRGEPFAAAARLGAALAHVTTVAAPPNTAAKDASDWRRWCDFCTLMGTPPIRDDHAANSGFDSLGHRRESLLLASFFIYVYERMRPRRFSDPAPRPASALSVLQSVRRVHSRMAGVDMVRTPLIKGVLSGLLREFVRRHGPEALLPHRKSPILPQHLRDIFARTSGVRVAGLTVSWNQPLWLNVAALLLTMFFAALRKAEIALAAGASFDFSCLSRSALSWSIAGESVAVPSDSALRGLGDGDFAVLQPPCSKNDPFGDVFGADPIFLPVP